jgi:ADP-ribosylglycohydrolase
MQTVSKTAKDAAGLERTRGALYGLFIGDALAMPVHWYYDRQALRRDYGRVATYRTPRPQHPDSILWRSRYQARHPRGEILHDQAPFWGRRNVHYHQFLKAGENTLNLQLVRQLMQSLAVKGAYRPQDYLSRYIDFMTTPGRHRDTYIEECHRNFFDNYARGRAPEKCGRDEKHIGGLSGIVPIIGFYRNRPERARAAAQAHLSLTHPGPRMAAAADLIMDLMLPVIAGAPLRQAILEAIDAQKTPLVGHPFRKWLKLPDETVVGRYLSTACYVEDAIPAVVYLALKYHADPEEMLVVNTNLGGDNAGRGAILGALAGAAGGIEAFPSSWIRGLVEPPPDRFVPR